MSVINSDIDYFKNLIQYLDDKPIQSVIPLEIERAFAIYKWHYHSLSKNTNCLAYTLLKKLTYDMYLLLNKLYLTRSDEQIKLVMIEFRDLKETIPDSQQEWVNFVQQNQCPKI